MRSPLVSLLAATFPLLVSATHKILDPGLGVCPAGMEKLMDAAWCQRLAGTNPWKGSVHDVFIPAGCSVDPKGEFVFNSYANGVASQKHYAVVCVGTTTTTSTTSTTTTTTSTTTTSTTVSTRTTTTITTTFGELEFTATDNYCVGWDGRDLLHTAEPSAMEANIGPEPWSECAKHCSDRFKCSGFEWYPQGLQGPEELEGVKAPPIKCFLILTEQKAMHGAPGTPVQVGSKCFVKNYRVCGKPGKPSCVQLRVAEAERQAAAGTSSGSGSSSGSSDSFTSISGSSDSISGSSASLSSTLVLPLVILLICSAAGVLITLKQNYPKKLRDMAGACMPEDDSDSADEEHMLSDDLDDEVHGRE